jgi:uncharacterized protein (TIGR00661 family)
MKILYAIQGTGNGHISRARDIIPCLMKKGELDVLISGTEADVDLGFPVKYKFKGLSFVFGQKGGVDLFSTYKKAKLKRFFDEVKSLPVKNYDIIINDFEPVSARACQLSHKDCIGLSHQAAVLNKKSPHPASNDMVGKSILKKYAPVTEKYGFHFKAYSEKIFTPVIRNEIRQASSIRLPHYTVYLPAYADEKIIKTLKEMRGVKWEVFSKHSKKAYEYKNISVFPINNEGFIMSLVTCTGVLCGAGFETPAEALFLQKKLMVIPMKGQYEQQCNAAALKEMGVPVLKKLRLKKVEKIMDWVNNGAIIPVDYPDITEQVIEEVFNKYSQWSHIPDTLLPARSVEKNNPQRIKLGRVLHQITG